MTANCVIRAKSFFFFFGLLQKLHEADYTYYFFFLSLSWLLKIADSATIRAILDMQAVNWWKTRDERQVRRYQ